MVKKLTKSDIELQNTVWEAERLKCMLDLKWLATKVLGYEDLGVMHSSLCKVIQSVNPIFFYLAGLPYFPTIESVKDAIKKNIDEIEIPERYKRYYQTTGLFERMFLMFRGSFKSTLITIAHTIQTMLICPDIRILICSHKKEDGSEPFLRAIKHHFMANDKFRRLFPEYCPKPNRLGLIEWGTKDSVTLPNRSPHCAFPEATIETAGMTTNVTGRHYDVIKADDLVTRDSVTNETMLQNTRQQYALLQFLFDQPEWGVKDIIGTPYHFADLYADLKRSNDVVRVQIPVLTEASEPTFHERFSKTGIEKIKQSAGMTSYDFSCQYMLNPVPPEDQTFRPEWFERLDFHYHKAPDLMKVYIFVDPANKRNRKSDYTAIMVIGVAEDKMLYLLDAIRDKLDVESRTNLALEIAQKWRTKRVYWESVGFQDTDRYILEKKSREAGYTLNPEPIKASNASKEDRIRGLQPIYERGMIRWPYKLTYHSKYEGRLIDMIQTLKDEMLMFPKCVHDDLIDCHAQLLQIHMSKPVDVVQQQAEDVFMWWRKQAIKMREKPKHVGFKGLRRRKVELPAKQAWR